jgi:hypothetical protein
MVSRQRRAPVVFIQGLWLHASSWNPWLQLFRDARYEPIAPGWPGEPSTVEEAREHPDLVANMGIDDATANPNRNSFAVRETALCMCAGLPRAGSADRSWARGSGRTPLIWAGSIATPAIPRS